MSGKHGVFLDTQPAGGVSLFFRLWFAIIKFLGLLLLRCMRPLAWPVLSIAEPIGRVSIRAEPKKPKSEGKEVLSVMSANLWHDWPRHRRLSERLESFVRLVEGEDIDILMLQEVARRSDICVDEWLADRLGMAYVYSRVNGHEKGIGFEEGLAVFSRYPLTKTYLTQLKPDFEPFARRSALGAELRTPFGAVPVFSVHLGLLPSQNAAHVGHLQTWVRSISGERTAIIGGDFNTREKTAQIAKVQRTWQDSFRQVHPNGNGTTFSVQMPWGSQFGQRRLDYIFLQPGDYSWEVLDACHLDAPSGPHSDHRAVLARIAPLSHRLA